MYQFQPGQSGNLAGRPPGSKGRACIPIRTQKKLLQLLTDRALEGDKIAQESLALILVCQSEAMNVS